MSVWKEMRIPLVTSLVTTVSPEGNPNASPKSWWSPVSYEPPIVMLSTKPESDTSKNIIETGLFVLHIPDQLQAERVLHTAKPLPYGENELDDVELDWEWMDRDVLDRKMPYVPSMPWMVCWVTRVFKAEENYSDHHIWFAQVGLAGGFREGEGVTEKVLLHRGKNVFAWVAEGEYIVRPY